jgi:hypothetical protein
MIRGDTPTFHIDIVDFNGDALDISSAYIWFTAKNGYSESDTDAVFQKTIGDGITVTDARLGQLDIVLSTEDTDDIVDRTNLKYDIQVKDVSGGIYTVSSGLLVVEPDITRRVT